MKVKFCGVEVWLHGIVLEDDDGMSYYTLAASSGSSLLVRASVAVDLSVVYTHSAPCWRVCEGKEGIKART